MNSDDIWRYIDDQRTDLADLVDGMDDASRNTPSLCDGWTVRDVAAHVTQSQMSFGRATLELLRYRFRFNTMMHRMAVDDSRSPQELASAMRAMPGSRRHPPGTSELDPLADVLVHGQDIAVPLGITRPMPTEAAAVAAQRLWDMGFPYHAKRTFRGIRFVADDTTLALGEGREFTAPVRDILMVLSGRDAPLATEIASARTT